MLQKMIVTSVVGDRATSVVREERSIAVVGKMGPQVLQGEDRTTSVVKEKVEL